MRTNNVAGLIACAALATAPLTFATHASAQALPPTSPPQIAPALVPANVVDLMTADGMTAFGAQWKHMEAKIVEGPALPAAMPGYKTSYDISPHAGEKGFDDSSWPTIEAKGLTDRRGGGKVSFLWYRTNLTVPAKIGNFETAGAKMVLTAYVDDYAEVWVNGEMPRRAGISSWADTLRSSPAVLYPRAPRNAGHERPPPAMEPGLRNAAAGAGRVYPQAIGERRHQGREAKHS